MNHILIFEEPTTHYTKHPFHLILSQLLLARDKGKMRNLLYLSLFIFDFRVSTWRLYLQKNIADIVSDVKSHMIIKQGSNFFGFNKAKFVFSSVVVICNFINNKFHKIHFPVTIFLLFTKYIFLLFIYVVTWSLSKNTLQTLGSYHFCIR